MMSKQYFTVNDRIPLPEKYKCYRKNRIRYINMANAFDIETTSFTDRGKYRATMYIWQVSINGVIIIGRTWDEFLELCDILKEHFNLYKEKILVIYVHNLSYEFQFMRRLFSWIDVFSLEERRPLYATAECGIQFRCSYLLSGMSLERVGNSLVNHKIKKLVGSLDYTKLRHSKTKLTTEEIAYCINDVKVVTAYIAERIAADGDITKIPLTKTGYVRKATRTACFGTDHRKRQFKRYRDFIKTLYLDVNEYNDLKSAFLGGFTHANAWHVDKTLYNVKSYDFTSSYPFVMVAFKYPMTKGVLCYPGFTEFKRLKNTYAWIVTMVFKRIRAKISYEHYLSYSHVKVEGNYDVDNGRIVYADFLMTTITNVDYDIIAKCYEWDEEPKIIRAYKYKLAYLPTPIIKSLLNFYADKTRLKGVHGREADYMTAKENTNSNYGMMVTDPLRDIITYDDEWGTTKVDVTKGINKYNQSRQRFLFYPWGVFVTAYARRNLWTGILEFKDDYVYSDTDSIKALNADWHTGYINSYNDAAIQMMKTAMAYHNLDFDLCNPADINGKRHMLGVWDYEGEYSRFRTLGAKRYMTEKDGEISLTVSGLNKKKAIPYLLDQYGKDGIFDIFSYDYETRRGIEIPPDYTGRLTMRYIDFETTGELTDYNGVTWGYHEMSSANMEKGVYLMSMGKQYAEYLAGIKEDNYGEAIYDI